MERWQGTEGAIMKRMIISVAILASCSGGSKAQEATPEPTEPTTAPSEAETTPPVGENMLSHWVYVTQVRDAVVQGNLSAAISAAKVADGQASPVTDESLDPFVAQMELKRTDVYASESISEAARATASLGQSCGACHFASGAQVEMSSPNAPPDGEGPKAHMQGHLWAVNAMWEGLVVPSDSRWQSGAAQLTALPMHRTEQSSEYVGTKVVKELGEKIHSVGTLANGVTEPEQRAELFAELIATCGDCHAQTMQGPDR